ncbi:MAG TPA: PepSY domain-containing protein [Gammaproteobacteria bacterium]|nr:PepSY domain-containing protein [Gammaproteobacteria bacterium]
MKSYKKIAQGILSVVVLGLSAISAQAALRVDMSDALQRLSNSGYTAEDQIKLVGTNYVAIVFDPSNQRASVSVNGNTGEVTFIKTLPPIRIDWLEAAKILEQQGYAVTELENKGDHYRATVYDSQNRAADVEVDKVTGKVIQHVIS